jgi:hypothetical protein
VVTPVSTVVAGTVGASAVVAGDGADVVAGGAGVVGVEGVGTGRVCVTAVAVDVAVDEVVPVL